MQIHHIFVLLAITTLNYLNQIRVFLVTIFLIFNLSSCVTFVQSGNGISTQQLNQLEEGKSKKDTVLKIIGAPDRIVKNNLEGTEIYIYEDLLVKSVTVGILPWIGYAKKADTGYQINLAFKDQTYLGYTVNEFNQSIISDNDLPQNISADQKSTSTCIASYSTTDEWFNEVPLDVLGFDGNIMEPSVAPNHNIIYFNDKPTQDSAMQIHWMERDKTSNDGRRWIYKGIVQGASIEHYLDGTPTLWIDSKNNKSYFYFISTRNFDSKDNFGSIYSGELVHRGNTATVNQITPKDQNTQIKIPGYLSMDVDVSFDGKTALVSKAKFSGAPYPDESQLEMYSIDSKGNLISNKELSAQMANIKNENCRVYAGNLSASGLELFYSILEVKNGTFAFRNLVAKRSKRTIPFNKGKIIAASTGDLTEGPSITEDGKYLYYHRKKDDGKIGLYRLQRRPKANSNL